MASLVSVSLLLFCQVIGVCGFSNQIEQDSSYSHYSGELRVEDGFSANFHPVSYFESGRQDDPEDELRKAVGNVAKEIIAEFAKKESSFSYFISEFIKFVANGVQVFSNAQDNWKNKNPSIFNFSRDVNDALESLKVTSTPIFDAMLQVLSLNISNTSFADSNKNLKGYRNARSSNLPITLSRRASQRQEINAQSMYNTGNLSFREQNKVIRKFDVTQSKSLNKRQTSGLNTEWWGPIEKVVSYLEGASAWYDYLLELYNALCLIEARKVAKKSQFIKWLGRNQVQESNLVDATERLHFEFNVIQANNSVISGANEQRLKYFNEIIDSLLRSTKDCEILEGTVTYVGHVVLLSDAIKDCFRTALKSKTLEILASVKFYIDVDLDLTGTTNLELVKFVTETVEIVDGSRVIDMSGRDAPNGTRRGINGKNGRHFLGIFGQLIGGNLTIISNGGNGGDGESATDYLRGISCKKPKYLVTDLVRFEKVGMKNATCCKRSSYYWYEGGDWVEGGHAGQAGQIRLFSTSQVPISVSYEGKDGIDGKTGEKTKGLDTIYDPPLELTLEKGIRRIGGHHWSRILCLYNDSNIKRGKEDPSPGKETPAKPQVDFIFDEHDVVLSLLNYKKFVRKDNNIFIRNSTVRWINILDDTPQIEDLHEPKDYAQEFYDFEVQRSKKVVTNSYEVLFYYTSLIYRSLFRAQESKKQNDNDLYKVYMFLHSAAIAKKHAITSPFEFIIVTDIAKYLNLEQGLVRTLKDLMTAESQYNHIQTLTAEYNSRIQDQFARGNEIIHGTIFPEIDRIENDLRRTVYSLLNEIQALKDAAQGDLKKLKKYRDDLQVHLALSIVLNTFKFIGNMVAMVHPAGLVVSCGAEAVNKLGNRPPRKPQLSGTQIPPSAGMYSEASSKRYRESVSRDLTGLSLLLNATKSKLTGYETPAAELITYIDETEKKIKVMQNITAKSSAKKENNGALESVQESVSLFFMYLMVRDYIKDVQNETLGILKKIYDNPVSESEQGVVRLNSSDYKGKIEGLTMAVNGGVDIIDMFITAGESLDEVSAQIDMVKQYLKALDDFANRVEKEMTAELESLFAGLSNVQDQLEGQPAVTLVTVGWRIQSVLQSARMNFKKSYTQGFMVADEVDFGLMELEDAFKLLIQIYMLLEGYKEQAALANFTAEVNTNREFFLGPINDPELQKVILSLRYILEAGVLIKRQRIAESSFRMWKFPFIDVPLCSLDSEFYDKDLSNPEDVKDFISEIDTRIQAMVSSVATGQSSIGPFDQYLINTHFDLMEPNTPIISWYNSSDHASLSSLLLGKQISLFADTLKGHTGCDAVKFKTLNVEFTSTNGSMELTKQIKAALDYYTIVLDHQGTNYYALGSRIYTLVGKGASISFSFKQVNGKPITSNEVYKKLSEGNLILSPYTFWKIQIIPPRGSESYDSLLPFVGTMDMHLEGEGTCVDKKFAKKEMFSPPDCSEVLN